MSTPVPTWPDEDYVAAASLVGRTCALLLLTEARWVHRRVETIDLLSAELVRRTSSVDLTVPGEVRSKLTVPGGESLLPVAMLAKKPLRNFDLRDEAGRAVPVVGRGHNGEIAHNALLGVAEFAAQKAGLGPLSDRTIADLRSVATLDSEEAGETLAAMHRASLDGDRQMQVLFDDDWSVFLLLRLASNYILLGVVHDVAQRRILKFGYDEPLEERRPLRQRLAEGLGGQVFFNFDAPAAARTASYHAEVVIPEDLRIEAAILYDDEDRTVQAIDLDADRGAIHAPEVAPEARTALLILLRAGRAGLPTIAFAVGVVTAALLIVGAFLLEPKADTGGPSVSVLLAAQALFVGLVAQRGEHRLVRRFFGFSRGLLALTGISALAAAAVVAFGGSHATIDAVWTIGAVITTIVACILGHSYWRAVPPTARERTS